MHHLKSFLVALFIMTTLSISLIVPQSVHAGGFSGTGAGVSGNPYVITSCAQFEQIKNRFLTDWFVLNNDIDCSGDGSSVMVGTSTPFTGNFDGQGHTITVNINAASNKVGLFAIANNATIANLNVAGNIIGNYYVGGIIGVSDSGGDTLTNDTVSATVSGAGYVGGLIGQLNNYNTAVSLISNSSTNGPIIGTDNYVGGLVGYIDDEGNSVTGDTTAVTISGSSHVTGLVRGPQFTGGLVGEFYVDYTANATVTNSSVTSKVADTTSGYVGGLFGGLSLGANNDAVTATFTGNNYSGLLQSTNSYVGGFAGEMVIDSFATTSSTNVTVSNNTTSGTLSGAGFIGGLIGHGNIFGESGGSFGTTLTMTGNSSSMDVSGTDGSAGGLIGEIDSYD